MSLINSSSNWMWCKGNNSSRKSFNVINIYGPHKTEDKISFWEDINKLAIENDSEPLCFIGDFNSIKFKEDRSGCIYNERDTVFFNSFIADHGLIELKGVNFSFTWFGPNLKKCKLDRVVVNDL